MALAVAVVATVVAPAASLAAAPTRKPLSRIYQGGDGSALYMRHVGDRVYGFGEHPERDYAYVLSGEVEADRISATWWNVPKGSKTGKGTVVFRWSQQGARLDRTSTDASIPRGFDAVEAGSFPWPSTRAAGFQATGTNRLTGAFEGDDGSRHYARETSHNVVWVAERATQLGVRPDWVSVFVGKRYPNGISGTFVDVPKGIGSMRGTFGASFLDDKRELRLLQRDKSKDRVRTRHLRPDYTLDWDAFADEVAGRLDDRTVGYGLALAHRGSVLRTRSGGWRRLAQDGEALPFTPHTVAQTASAAKTISAVAIIKALHERGLTVDSEVAPFLPSCIKRGKSISTLTFAHILTHTSGLPNGTCNGRDPLDCLLEILAEGRTQSRSRTYNNKAYDLLRLLVPLVTQTKASKGEFELFKCKSTGGEINERMAGKFTAYVREEVLAPADAEGTWYPGDSPTGDYSLNYNCQTPLAGARCKPTHKGEAMTPEYHLRSASGKMAMSAVNYVKFLSALERGLIIPSRLVETMKGGRGYRMGFDTVENGAAGEYHWKNGGCPSLVDRHLERGCQTMAMVFPGDVQAYITINSKDNTYSGRLDDFLRRAFDRALIGDV